MTDTIREWKEWANSPAGGLSQEALSKMDKNSEEFKAILAKNNGIPIPQGGIPSQNIVDRYRVQNTGVQTPLTNAGQWWMYDNPVKQFKINHPYIYGDDMLIKNGDAYGRINYNTPSILDGLNIAPELQRNNQISPEELLLQHLNQRGLA